jgi:uncharacterized membrane protein YqjE
MTDQVKTTIPALIREVVSDARQLIHEEVLLARAEAREQAVEAKTLGLIAGAALLCALTGMILIAAAIGVALAGLLDWPLWGGIGIVAVLFCVVGFVLYRMGRSRLATLQIMPKTRASLQENIAWIQRQSSGK